MSAPPDHGPARAAELVRQLGLQPHPEGGWYGEVFRSAHAVDPLDGRPRRAALTTIDFLLDAGQFSAWHRVRSDEAWHWLEGVPLVLHLLAPDLLAAHSITLGPVRAERRPRHVVPALWWQAAEPAQPANAANAGEPAYCYVGATVGPGFDFADFSFGRDHAPLREALAQRHPAWQRLL
jgi:uncharacterized protein